MKINFAVEIDRHDFREAMAGVLNAQGDDDLTTRYTESEPAAPFSTTPFKAPDYVRELAGLPEPFGFESFERIKEESRGSIEVMAKAIADLLLLEDIEDHLPDHDYRPNSVHFVFWKVATLYGIKLAYCADAAEVHNELSAVSYLLMETLEDAAVEILTFYQGHYGLHD
jgi:hypothetical protein